MTIDAYEIQFEDEFTKNSDRLANKKKFRTLPKQIRELAEEAQKGNFPGDLISRMDVPCPFEVYKLRLPNPDANVGKSNGYRVYYVVITEKRIVVFLAIYYKKEEADVSDTYIRGLIDGVFLDLLPEEE
jgi:mRNA-degrading endonuclease RelE of RelBE toxin-antitoxin system